MRYAELSLKPLPHPQANPRIEPRLDTGLLTSEVYSPGKAVVFILATSLIGWAIVLLSIYGVIASL